MTIKSKFIAITVAYAAIAIVVSSVLLISFKRTDETAATSSHIYKATEEISNLRILTAEMLNEHEKKAHEDWLARFGAVQQETEKLFEEGAFGEETKQKLEGHLNFTLETFNKLSAIHDSKNDEFIKKQKNELLIQTLYLSEVFNKELIKDTNETKDRVFHNIFIIYLELIGLLVFTLITLLLLQKTIVDRLSSASEIIKRITNGETGIKIPKIIKDDEIGSLFNSARKITLSSTKACNILEQKVSKQTEQIKTTLAETEKQNKTLEKTEKAMLNILEDVQEEKNKAEVLAQDLEKFMLAVEGTSEGVVITNGEGTVLYTNPAINKISGFSKSEIIGKKVGTKKLWGGQMDEGFYKNLWNSVKIDKKPFAGEIKNKSKSGQEYWAETSISPILDDAGEVKFFVGIQKDKTKEIEVDRAKTEFVSLASHQLRTPLSSINWYSEMLLNEEVGKINDSQKEYLTEVFQGNRRMIDLVNSLLNVSRIELGTFSIDPEQVDVKSIINSLLKELKIDTAGKKIKVKKDIATKLPKIQADPQLLRIILQNLFTNAIKYTPLKGSVEICAQIKKKGEKAERKTTRKDSLFISVKDSGIGIPFHQQKNIFTKLFRADNAKKREADGNGLGLYIIKSIMDQCDGKVWFTSKENKGTSFFILIPLEGMMKKEGTKKLSPFS